MALFSKRMVQHACANLLTNTHAGLLHFDIADEILGNKNDGSQHCYEFLSNDNLDSNNARIAR